MKLKTEAFIHSLVVQRSGLALLAYIGNVESGKQQVFIGAEQHKMRERLGAMASSNLKDYCASTLLALSAPGR